MSKIKRLKHVSRSQFSRIENGEIMPDAGEVIVLVLVLDVSSGCLKVKEIGVVASSNCAYCVG